LPKRRFKAQPFSSRPRNHSKLSSIRNNTIELLSLMIVRNVTTVSKITWSSCTIKICRREDGRIKPATIPTVMVALVANSMTLTLTRLIQLSFSCHGTLTTTPRNSRCRQGPNQTRTTSTCKLMAGSSRVNHSQRVARSRHRIKTIC